jgi:hypothetical protein
MSILDLKRVEEDKEAKKTLLIATVSNKHCTKTANFRELRAIASALGQGDTLQASLLSGGVTNYSYKVYLRENPELALFAKFAFKYAL